MTSPTVIIGGGIMGMVTAALLRKRHPGKPIYIIEQSDHAGGLYTSMYYPEGGYFDYGMHILYDTGIEEVDTFLHSLLPSDQWHILEGNHKDIAGIFWNGILQYHSPYLDLRTLPEEELRRCIEGVYEAARVKSASTPDDAKRYFEEHFGKPAAMYWQEVIEKLYGVPADQVSVWATRQPAMNRVILKNTNAMQDVMQSPDLRARIAYPDQMQLPSIRTTSQCGWYPKQFGMIHVINALERHLITSDVKFIFNAQVEQLTIQNNRISAMSVCSERSAPIILEGVEYCYWTAGMASLGSLLGTSVNKIVHQKQAKAAHLHLRFAEPPRMGSLYQLYCFDVRYKTFRVTNYANYCHAAHNAKGYPLCLEYWPNEPMPDHMILKQAMDELRVFGVIPEGTLPTFSAIKHVHNHHYMFLRSFMDESARIRHSIHQAGIKNLITIGISAGEGRLLFYEVLMDAYHKLR